ncbi:MAG: TatD family deoxyribonuclease [Deltaproteobacteria bacterium]|nr:TatD family deoxyribonuclease [Deltaproteobacteria bacterium]MBM4316555.1 TatD family deoxyribonuclease [Deltaproteobacteria bacterium]
MTSVPRGYLSEFQTPKTFAKRSFLGEHISMDSHQWIDAHCHLASKRFTHTLAAVIERSLRAGVTGWVQGGIEPSDWNRQKLLQIQYGKRFLTSFGLHPWWVASATAESLDSAMKVLETLLPHADAHGELGLDFGQEHDKNRLQQISAFRSQLGLAKQHRKPLILHIVRAHSEALEILKALAPFPKGGIVHSFTGSLEIAQEYCKLGLLISIGGSVTHKGYFALKKAIPFLSLPQLVVETDSPDQLPNLIGVDPQSPNEPKYLLEIAKVLGELKGVTAEEVLNQSTDNLKKLFEIT